MLLAALVCAVPAGAAERQLTLTSFDRIRVDGPFTVEATTRATPLARVSGDARALDLIEVRVEGGTLLVRASNRGWGERGRADVPAALVRVQTPALRSAGVVGSGRLTIAGPVTGERVDLTVTGGGELSVPGIAANELAATLIGTGRMRLGGTARRARLIGNGAGEIAAGPLTAGDVTVRSEGTTAVTVTARYTANLTSTGVGPIAVLGSPECKTRALAGGPIRCGVARP